MQAGAIDAASAVDAERSLEDSRLEQLKEIGFPVFGSDLRKRFNFILDCGSGRTDICPDAVCGIPL